MIISSVLDETSYLLAHLNSNPTLNIASLQYTKASDVYHRIEHCGLPRIQQ
jgi:hypothetical protein